MRHNSIEFKTVAEIIDWNYRLAREGIKIPKTLVVNQSVFDELNLLSVYSSQPCDNWVTPPKMVTRLYTPCGPINLVTNDY